MINCERHRETLLDYLFDLLDEPERRGLEEHLRTCADCATDLDRARRHQQTLAQAARATFPDVRFEAPREEAAPATLPFRPRPVRRWAGWAVAAGVLVALGGPAAWYWQRGGDAGNGNGGVSGLIDDQLAHVNGKSTGAAKVDDGNRTFTPLTANQLSAQIRLEKATYRVGEKVAVTYELKNLGKTPVTVWHRGFWPNHQIFVRDAAGADVARRPLGEERHRAFGGAGADKNAPVTVQPGQADAAWEAYDLRAMFALEQPGKYTVQYLHQAEGPGGEKVPVRSNVAAFEVVR